MRLRHRALTIAQSAGPGKLDGTHLMKISHAVSTGNVVRVPEGPDHMRPAESRIHVARGIGYPKAAEANVCQ